MSLQKIETFAIDLTDTQSLDLRSTPITSLALSYIKGLKDLKALDLSETANVGNEGREFHALIQRRFSRAENGLSARMKP